MPKSIAPEQQALFNRELFAAIEANNIDEVKKSLNKGASVHTRDHNDETPLHHAIKVDSNIFIIKVLLERRPEIDAQEACGWTPLHIAVCNDNIDVVNLLLKEGASIYVENNEGNTPINGRRDPFKDKNRGEIRAALKFRASMNGHIYYAFHDVYQSVCAHKLEVVSTLAGAAIVYALLKPETIKVSFDPKPISRMLDSIGQSIGLSI